MFRVLEFISELIGWLLILASPLLLGLGIGALIYLPNPNMVRLIIGLSIALIGFVAGAIWATKIWKTKGTIWYLSQIMATPELDKIDKDKKNENIETENKKPASN
jgi:hypothetical protein